MIERFALYLIDSLGIRSALGIFFSPDDGHAHLWCLRHIKANLKKAGFTKCFLTSSMILVVHMRLYN